MKLMQSHCLAELQDDTRDAAKAWSVLALYTTGVERIFDAADAPDMDSMFGQVIIDDLAAILAMACMKRAFDGSDDIQDAFIVQTEENLRAIDAVSSQRQVEALTRRGKSKGMADDAELFGQARRKKQKTCACACKVQSCTICVSFYGKHSCRKC